MERKIENHEVHRLMGVVSVLRYIILGLDLLALTEGIFYIIHPTPYLLGNLYGYAILVVLLGNIVLALIGGSRRYMDYCYLMLHTISMFLIPILNTLAASDVQNKTSQSIIVLILYNTLFLWGAVSSGLRISDGFKSRRRNAMKKAQTQSGRFKNVIRWVAVILLCGCLLAGIFFSYILLGKSTGNMIEGFIPEYAVFWGLLVLGASTLIIRLRWRRKGSAVNKVILVAGVIICAICLIPLASVPAMIRNADSAYQEAFGSAYLEDASISEQNGFMKSPFSLQNYFFGTRTHNYTAHENILFYTGTDGKDAGLQLRFDVYMPTESENCLTAPHSVLIRIHGGAWVMGDKGASNYSEINKHFANLGYVVFDIQYGLSDRNTSFASSVVPASVKGKFDIDDMIRHIGIFTTYLAEHADAYNADLNSVFISGASAGGQLAVAATLGITGGKYTDRLDSRLSIKGLIPYYPANGLGRGFGGTKDLVDPVALVDKNSPPCLIYHGTHDGIVDPQIAALLQQTYLEKSDAPCALLWMTYAGHGSDFYTPGYYNQVFSYYMERFMYCLKDQ